MDPNISTDTGEMIVKRVSVPIGLEELMEGLVKEVLISKPDDIYLFAAKYFSQLLTHRGQPKAKTLRSAQSLKDHGEKRFHTKIPVQAGTKQLSRQFSIRGESPNKNLESPIVSNKPRLYNRNELKYKRRNTGPQTILENQVVARKQYSRSVSDERSHIGSNGRKEPKEADSPKGALRNERGLRKADVKKNITRIPAKTGANEPENKQGKIVDETGGKIAGGNIADGDDLSNTTGKVPFDKDNNDHFPPNTESVDSEMNSFVNGIEVDSNGTISSQTEKHKPAEADVIGDKRVSNGEGDDVETKKEKSNENKGGTKQLEVQDTESKTKDHEIDIDVERSENKGGTKQLEVQNTESKTKDNEIDIDVERSDSSGKKILEEEEKSNIVLEDNEQNIGETGIAVIAENANKIKKHLNGKKQEHESKDNEKRGLNQSNTPNLLVGTTNQENNFIEVVKNSESEDRVGNRGENKEATMSKEEVEQKAGDYERKTNSGQSPNASDRRTQEGVMNIAEQKLDDRGKEESLDGSDTSGTKRDKREIKEKNDINAFEKNNEPGVSCIGQTKETNTSIGGIRIVDQKHEGTEISDKEPKITSPIDNSRGYEGDVNNKEDMKLEDTKEEANSKQPDTSTKNDQIETENESGKHVSEENINEHHHEIVKKNSTLADLTKEKNNETEEPYKSITDNLSTLKDEVEVVNKVESKLADCVEENVDQIGCNSSEKNNSKPSNPDEKKILTSQDKSGNGTQIFSEIATGVQVEKQNESEIPVEKKNNSTFTSGNSDHKKAHQLEEMKTDVSEVKGVSGTNVSRTQQSCSEQISTLSGENQENSSELQSMSQVDSKFSEGNTDDNHQDPLNKQAGEIAIEDETNEAAAYGSVLPLNEKDHDDGVKAEFVAAEDAKNENVEKINDAKESSIPEVTENFNVSVEKKSLITTAGHKGESSKNTLEIELQDESSSQSSKESPSREISVNNDAAKGDGKNTRRIEEKATGVSGQYSDHKFSESLSFNKGLNVLSGSGKFAVIEKNSSSKPDESNNGVSEDVGTKSSTTNESSEACESIVVQTNSGDDIVKSNDGFIEVENTVVKNELSTKSSPTIGETIQNSIEKDGSRELEGTIPIEGGHEGIKNHSDSTYSSNTSNRDSISKMETFENTKNENQKTLDTINAKLAKIEQSTSVDLKKSVEEDSINHGGELLSNNDAKDGQKTNDQMENLFVKKNVTPLTEDDSSNSGDLIKTIPNVDKEEKKNLKISAENDIPSDMRQDKVAVEEIISSTNDEQSLVDMTKKMIQEEKLNSEKYTTVSNIPPENSVIVDRVAKNYVNYVIDKKKHTVPTNESDEDTNVGDQILDNKAKYAITNSNEAKQPSSNKADEYILETNEHLNKTEGKTVSQEEILDTTQQPGNVKIMSSYDGSKLREELQKVEQLSKLTTFKPSFNPFHLRQEIENASLHKTSDDENKKETKHHNSLTMAAAALKIQAMWRGFIVRRSITKRDVEHRDENSNVLKEKNQVLCSVHETPDDILQAIIMIQRLWRGYKARRNLRDIHLREIKNADQKDYADTMLAAIMIQKWWRGFKARKILKMQKSKHIDASGSASKKENASMEIDQRPMSKDSTDSAATVIFNEPIGNNDSSIDKSFGSETKEHSEMNALLDEILDYPVIEEQHLIDTYQNKLLDRISGKNDDFNEELEVYKALTSKRLEELEAGEESSLGSIQDSLPPKPHGMKSKLESLAEEPTEENESSKLYTFCSVPSPLRRESKIVDCEPVSDSVETIDKKEDHTVKNLLQHSTSSSQLTESAKSTSPSVRSTSLDIKNEHGDDNNAMLLHTGELHDSLVLPLPKKVNESLKTDGEGTVSVGVKTGDEVANILSNAGLLHTGELHDSVVIPFSIAKATKNASKEKEEAGEGDLEALPVVTVNFEDNAVPLGVQVLQAPAPGAVTAARAGIPVIGSAHGLLAPPVERKKTLSSSSMGSDESDETATQREISMESEAARKIQAGFRGYQVRKQLKLKNGSSDLPNSRRQIRPKGSQKDSGRSLTKPKEIEEKSAVKIQAGVRGFLVRRRQKKQINQ